MTPQPTKTREVVAIVRATTVLDAHGFHSRRVHLARVPDAQGVFIRVDEMGPVEFAAGEWKPPRTLRRGKAQLLTYLIEGQWECAEQGHRVAQLRAGDAHWQTTHDDLVRHDGTAASMGDGGTVHCIQITLRGTGDMVDDWEVVRAGDIPHVSGAASARVLAGSLLSMPGAFCPERAPVIADWQVTAGAFVGIPVDFKQQVLLYAYQDVVWVGADGLALREGQLAVLGPGNQLVLRGPERSLRPARVLLLVGPARVKRRR